MAVETPDERCRQRGAVEDTAHSVRLLFEVMIVAFFPSGARAGDRGPGRESASS